MKRRILTPRRVLLFVLAYVVLSWAAIISVDFLNLFGLQRLSMELSPLPLLWFEIYSEAAWTERLQWLLLALGLFIALRLLFQARRIPPEASYATALALSVGLSLMLIEDSLNFRHAVANEYLIAWFGEPLPSRVRLLWELTFYSVLAGFMGAGLWFLWRDHHHDIPRRIWLLLLLAYAIYGSVGFASAARRVGNWQERLGEWLIQTLELADQPAWSLALERMEIWRETSSEYNFTLGYLLTDHLLEETVELMAAGLLAASVVAVYQEISSKKKTEQA